MNKEDQVSAAQAMGAKMAKMAADEFGLCMATNIVAIAAALLVAAHAGHHGKEPEVDIANNVATFKENATMAYEDLTSMLDKLKAAEAASRKFDA